MKDVIEFPVVGTTYARESILKLLQEGDVLLLDPQTDNPYDKDAIMVKAGDEYIGYVPNKGYSCSNCLSHVGIEDGYCKKCEFPSSYFVKGGLATRLRLSNALSKAHVCYVKESGKSDKFSSIMAKLILE